MACYQMYLTLSVLISCYVNANYEYERLKVLSHLADISRVPWNSQYDTYQTASSEVLPHYYDSYESSEDRSKDDFGSSSEHIPLSSVKKNPIENKSLKKPISPIYTSFANKDSTKYKELAPNSGVAYCQEIKTKLIGKESKSQKGVTTCYKCNDPKTGSTYERCLYNSRPEESASANTRERFLAVPVGFRYRRSSFGKDKDDYGKPYNPYRFTDEYFADAAYDVPAAYESKGEKCDKVVKDSMVCMVCKDAETNSKYEQCSYVKQPREEAYTYTKSSSFGKPQEQRNNDNDRYHEESFYSEPTRRNDRTASTVEEPREYFYPSEIYPKESAIANKQEEVQDVSSADCKQVQKDSKTCTVCKDSKNGGTYERCSYTYQPSNKLYKYSRSKSFGYPDKISDSIRDNTDKITQASDKSKNLDYPQSSSDSTHEDAYSDKSEATSTSHDSPGRNSEHSNPEKSSNYGLASSNDDSESYKGEAISSSDRAKSASEPYSENINTDHCKKIQKDSMTCTICKDPTTGNDFEQCSYSYRPSDKLFSYTKSSSFGNSKKNDKSRETPQENEQSDSSETAKNSHEYVPAQTYEASTTDEEKSEDDTGGKKGSDAGYLHTAKKKAEIEGFLQNFQKKDRSKCKKIMRDKMTCYQCVDEEGFQKEECVFVTGQEPNKDRLAFHEIKEFQIDPASSHTRERKLRNSKTETEVDDLPLEPHMSASKNSYVRLEKPDNDYPDEASSHTAEETKEAEPYDYTSETRSRYDKVLGLTLPAYMFTTSEHEAAFDEVVASSYDQR